jgi:hypothetical protein
MLMGNLFVAALDYYIALSHYYLILAWFSAVYFYPDGLAEADLSFIDTKRKPACGIVASPSFKRNIVSLWTVVR